MKFQLNGTVSDVLITIYIIVSLFYRIQFEKAINATPIQSVAIGISLLLIVWSLIKMKVLNPHWFGLFSSKKKK
ncbi:hypothetical protein [Polaribacter tangerinus]|uniref:hypothetical protein n=1 Tax=Polaribacter tangerinus TaxID=1920034 RepID=UPI000B4B0D77|nr:hypothetical protein [Polaribacter tangerinus]